jgi:crotonobetaine/carnitine-CoA ligase
MDIATGTTLQSLWAQCVESRPQAEFLVFEDPDTGIAERFSYGAFDKRINRASNVFLQCGVTRGGKVAVYLNNSVEFLECFFGLTRIGAVVVPINPSYTLNECKDIINRCGVSLLVAEGELRGLEGATLWNAPTLFVDRAKTGSSCPAQPDSWDELTSKASDSLTVLSVVNDGDMAEIMFTSGTTSQPKGVILTHANLVFSGLYCNWEMQMSQTDRFATAMVVTHVNFQLSALMPVLTAGATLILLKRYSASRFWREIRNHHATLVQSMAMMVRTMLAQPPNEDERNHCVRDVHYFLPLTDEEKQRFEQRFNVGILNNYGSTESLVGCITDIPLQPRNWPSIGKAGLGYEVRIRKESGTDADPGQCGEIQIHGVPGRSLMAGYWNDGDATARALDPDGWYHTGDWGYADHNGWIYFLDRHEDLIKRAGENISANEVEHVLLTCPGVSEAAVVGIPDPIRDQAVKAVIVIEPHSGTSKEQVREFVANRLACFKVPTVIEVRDALPRGAYGKVLKNLLKD